MYAPVVPSKTMPDSKETRRRSVTGILALFCYILTFGLLDYFSSWEFRRLIRFCPCEYYYIDTHYVWVACGTCENPTPLQPFPFGHFYLWFCQF